MNAHRSISIALSAALLASFAVAEPPPRANMTCYTYPREISEQ